MTVRMLLILLLSLFPVALTGCANGPAPGDLSPPQVCAAASQAGATAETVAQALHDAGIAEEKIAALIPLLRTGRLILSATCAILVPSSP